MLCIAIEPRFYLVWASRVPFDRLRVGGCWSEVKVAQARNVPRPPAFAEGRPSVKRVNSRGPHIQKPPQT